MSKKNKRFSVFFFIFSLVLFIKSVSLAVGDESEAVTKVSQANDSLRAAYLSILETEKAGGDISELVALLNTALGYYSEANRAFNSGEYDAAVQLASKAVEASNVVLETDIDLIVIAGQVKGEAFRNQLFLSFGVVCSIVILGFMSWTQFKVYYIHRMMVSRPEVVVDES